MLAVFARLPIQGVALSAGAAHLGTLPFSVLDAGSGIDLKIKVGVRG